MSGKISQQRIREAAEELVNVRYGSTTGTQASLAGEDMRYWQIGGERVSRNKTKKAATSAVKKTKIGNSDNHQSAPKKHKEVVGLVPPSKNAIETVKKQNSYSPKKVAKSRKDIGRIFSRFDEDSPNISAETLEIRQIYRQAEKKGTHPDSYIKVPPLGKSMSMKDLRWYLSKKVAEENDAARNKN